MTVPHPARTSLLLIVAALLVLTPAQALINLDGQRNQLFIFGNATFGYDSNIFS